jgi:1-phosphofructokinase
MTAGESARTSAHHVSRPAVAVFAPSPIVTVTLERGEGETPEIHFHAGGQGFWVARMAAELGARVLLCSALGGESGRVLERLLVDRAEIELRAAKVSAANGAYVHDRRAGTRAVIGETPGGRLTRHGLDELYGTTLTAALEAEVTLLTGPQPGTAIPGDTYRRLAIDLRQNGRPVLADVTGEHLQGSLAGGAELVKLNDEQAVGAGFAVRRDTASLRGALERISELGAENVLVSRADEPALALADGRLIELRGPRFSAIEPRGAGDSMFAALGVGFAHGRSIEDTLRMAVAAGALNATRRGLGTGQRANVERLMQQVEIADAA